ncbi:hypothetical protein LTR09_012395 [Extremus antarcticus]|uniref:DJ-1/PfpI domain-containing protein n=1 Tax=Extremus antarcticus TaxID=702011 RepID=A0AAJ0D542_9PEZI|nr:hypothetical protein LTR09_012395 [Extremus antarcticus]
MTELTVGLLLFPTFEVLDMAGPIEVLNVLSIYMGKSLQLHVIAATLDPVSPGPIEPGTSSSFAGQQLYMPTNTLDNAPALDLLIVPGGPGSGNKEALRPFLDFIQNVCKGYKGHPPAGYLFSVCSGSLLLAWAGVLDGKRATTNKSFWDFITSNGPKTHWVAKARWVTSGNVWTTSGVTAGIDGMLALVSSIWSEDTAEKVGATIEHNRAKASDDDPWATHYGCQDVLPVTG